MMVRIGVLMEEVMAVMGALWRILQMIGRINTLYYATLHYTTLHYTSLHYMDM